MVNKFLWIAAFFAMAASLCASQRNEIVLLTSADNPPYEFVRSGEIVGFDVDLAKLIAEKLGKKLVVKDVPFASIVPSLMAKHGDLAISALTPTDARRENVDFSINYQENISAIVLAKMDELAFADGKNAVFPTALLEGKAIGVQLGTHHETDVAKANIPNATVKRYDNIGTMVAEISNSANGVGTLYALVIGESEARAIVRKNPKLRCFRLQFADSFAVALPKNSPLRTEINRIIELLRETGKLSDLETKWDINSEN
ncbi:MAG: ABC transporter substrate-binding protein [Puniceicoccales bacterium]|jgi:polar amino acid transport system substrate-binding protein|nr:ABC transporter substrate-binding protein [Puniceicoccales bacterium]